MTKKFKNAIVIGRMQLLHNPHCGLIQHALSIADHVVIVLGSAFKARSSKNPFVVDERASMISLTLEPGQEERVKFVAVRDYHDDQRWLTAVKAAVLSVVQDAPNTAIVGHIKDPSSDYLRKAEYAFRPWEFVGGPFVGEVHATALRQIYFEQQPAAAAKLFKGIVPDPVIDYLMGWRRLGHFERLQREHNALEEERKLWASAPYPVTVNTADVVLTCGDYALMVRRGTENGFGLLAWPGGHIMPRETSYQAAIRELVEETGLGIHAEVLHKFYRNMLDFEHPDRSNRPVRVLTKAFYFALPAPKDKDHLPYVRGRDDAQWAGFIHKSELPSLEPEFFEDHYLFAEPLMVENTD